MSEQRKYAILFAATLLCAQKMIGAMDTDNELGKTVFCGSSDSGGRVYYGEDR
jgi:hypothetical protein